MIRAVVQNGVIQPLEPLPPDWHDGREVVVGDGRDQSTALGAQETFLARAQRLDHGGHGDAALDLIYDSIDELMHSGALGQLDSLLAHVSAVDLSTDILLGILTATLPARASLPARRWLFPEIEQTLRARGHFEDGILTGLDG